MLLASPGVHSGVAFLPCRAADPKPEPSSYPKLLKTLGDHARRKRLELGLLQEEVARQTGVDETTICNWEGNKSSPFLRYIPAIIRFLGYNPLPVGQSFQEKLVAFRQALGLSQKEVARTLGVDPSTVRNWEAGRHRPTKRSCETIQEFFNDLNLDKAE
jgi:transcriptional regulator with XRE-family HTH domain